MESGRFNGITDLAPRRDRDLAGLKRWILSYSLVQSTDGGSLQAVDNSCNSLPFETKAERRKASPLLMGSPNQFPVCLRNYLALDISM